MHIRSSSFFAALLAGVLALPLLYVGSAQAIPAFTRQHKTECFTCHTVFPELTEQGENFKKNSYVWLETKGAKKESKKDEKKDGKKGLNEREYLILSSLPDYVPLSISGAFNASYDDQRPDDGNRFDFVTRYVRLQGAGSMNDKLGFWLSYNLYTEGPFTGNTTNASLNGNVPANNTPDLSDAYVQARHIFSTPVNFKAGRIRPSLSLWKGTNRTSVTEMATTWYTVGDSLFYTDAAADGMEFNTILNGRVFLAGGAVKRKNQKNIDGYGSIQLKLGGADFEGREAPLNLDEDSIFDYLTVTLGIYGYTGTNNVGLNKQVNHYHRVGAEGDFRYQRYRLKLASAFGNDDNAVVDSAFVSGPQTGSQSRVYAAEALYLIGSELIPSFRYEYQDDGASITRRYIPTLAYAALQNAKVVLEYKHQDTSKLTDNTVNASLVVAF